jgi:hypothetical protein
MRYIGGMNRSTSTLFDLLESRQLLSPTIPTFGVSPSVVTPGNTITLTAVPASDVPIRAVTFFRDIDGNGRWTPGVDVDLGAVFVAGGGGAYTKSVSTDLSWPRNTRIAADVVDTNGTWSSAPVVRNATINRRPTISVLNVSPAANIPRGSNITVTVTANDDSVVRAASLFLDINDDGFWTAGVDVALGDIFNGVPSGNSTVFTKTITTSTTWPASVSLCADVVDDNNTWSQIPVSQPITTRAINPLTARVTSLSSTNAAARGGERDRELTVTVTGDTAIGAATAFLDFNNDGRWTPNVDISLGTLFGNPNGGQYTFAIPATQDLRGADSIPVVADAMNVLGVWTTNTVQYTLLDAGQVQITSFEVYQVAPSTYRFVVQTDAPAGYSAVSAVRVFVDNNGNNLADMSDSFVASNDTPTSGSNNRRRFDFTAMFVGSAPARFAVNAAFVLSSSMADNVANSRIRSSPVYGVQSQRPSVDQVEIDFLNQISPPVEGPVRRGVNAGITVDFTSPLGADVISFFVDRNQDGLWTPGTDIDLGFRTMAGELSGVVTTYLTIPEINAPFIAIAATLRDRSGRGNDAWSAPFSPNVSRFYKAPVISGVSNLNIAQGTNLTFTMDIADSDGVRAASAFIDIGNNGGPDMSDRIGYPGLYQRNIYDGRWIVTITTQDLAPGIYTVVLAAVDRYTGSPNRPGGLQFGLWSPRTFITLTIA